MLCDDRTMLDASCFVLGGKINQKGRRSGSGVESLRVYRSHCLPRHSIGKKERNLQVAGHCRRVGDLPGSRRAFMALLSITGLGGSSVLEGETVLCPQACPVSEDNGMFSAT